MAASPSPDDTVDVGSLGPGLQAALQLRFSHRATVVSATVCLPTVVGSMSWRAATDITRCPGDAGSLDGSPHSSWRCRGESGRSRIIPPARE
ncbi:hypothetical protein DK419_00880 [Methylobacterium terrae]|uniref:Uncharacterized protein n=1 Tax=Methylobacterium terrae TaxID=2202827 RepID=A0A2U8WG04_9HYPH|nr:hypothetical protein DK419_00880 [Methylobacterium terrae]